jgi:hypothetical protein
MRAVSMVQMERSFSTSGLIGCSIRKGDTLPDVGSGQGLIAFAALDRVGDEGKGIAMSVRSTATPNVGTGRHLRSLDPDSEGPRPEAVPVV